ncbi:DUF2325 domain-containing protein [Candidatus Pyrohabitans sp.]
MTIVVIGGIDRLERHYKRAASNKGYKAHVFSTFKANVAKKIPGSKGVILFTNQVSHSLARIVTVTAKKSGVPVVRTHKSSLSAFKQSLDDLCNNHNAHIQGN